MGGKAPKKSQVPKITISDTEANDNSARPKGIVQTRYIFTLMMFLGMLIGVANDLALSIVIVGMVDRSKCSKCYFPRDWPQNLCISANAVSSNQSLSVAVETECTVGNVTHEEGNCGHPNNCKFRWDAKEQGLILGGFSIGYTATQLIGGIIAQRLGGKWVFGPAIFLSSALSFLLPEVTRTWGIPAIMAMRVTQGIIQGPQTPAFYTICAKWLPTPEKNRMLSFILTGK